MTEPDDADEWWVLSTLMKDRIENRRDAWQDNSRFEPLCITTRKKGKGSASLKIVSPMPVVPNPVSEVIYVNPFSIITVFSSFSPMLRW